MKINSFKGKLGRLLLTAALLLMICPAITGVLIAQEAQAATTANITVLVTPGAIGITCNSTSYNFGTLALSATAQTDTAYFGITNASTVETDITIGTVNATWTGGATPWTHSNTATAGDDTVGMNANRGGTWGVSDVIVKSSSLNYIYENCPASTDFDFGLQILMPTTTTVTDQKGNQVQITAAAS